MSEAELQYNVMDLATALGFLAYHVYRSDMTNPGFPDCCIAGHGQVLFAELKSEKGRVGAHQIRWMSAIKATRPPNQVAMYLWRPSDWVDGTIEKVLKEIKRGVVVESDTA